MPADTTYGVQLAVELGIGRASDAARWGQSPWGKASRWGHTDTTVGDWVDVTCDVLDDVRLTAGSNTDDGVTRRWESASAAFTLDGSQWDPWNGPHADVIGDRVPARVRWRYPDEPGPPQVVRSNYVPNPSFEVNTAGWAASGGGVLTRSTVEHHGAGVAALQVVTTTAADSGMSSPLTPMPVTGGRPYTLSAWVKAPAGAALKVVWRVQTPLLDVVVNFTGTGQWERITYPNRAGVAGQSGYIVSIRTRTTHAAALTFYVDELMIEDAGAAGTYFDGSTPDTTGRLYDWTGTPHASTSTESTPTTTTHPWTPAFTGFIATRGYAWNPDERQAGVACVDGTSVLVASDRVATAPAGAGETAAARVTRIATAALWAGALDVTAGGTTVQATTLDTPAWDELLQVADTDLALLWITRAGALAYRPRGRVGVGVVLAGRLVVCPAGPADVQVMTLGRNQPSVTRNRVEVARRKDDTIVGDVPVVARIEDRQSIARFQAHDFKRTDLWHTDDTWSTVVAQAVMGAGAWPSPAPGQLAVDTITGDPRVAVLLLTVEPNMAFDVVDDGGRTYRQAVIGWDMALSHDGIEAVLHVEDITRWSNVAHWGTAHWGVDRWGIGGI
jgi:hypothetical protein